MTPINAAYGNAGATMLKDNRCDGCGGSGKSGPFKCPECQGSGTKWAI